MFPGNGAHNTRKRTDTSVTLSTGVSFQTTGGGHFMFYTVTHPLSLTHPARRVWASATLSRRLRHIFSYIEKFLPFNPSNPHPLAAERDVHILPQAGRRKTILAVLQMAEEFHVKQRNCSLYHLFFQKILIPIHFNLLTERDV